LAAGTDPVAGYEDIVVAREPRRWPASRAAAGRCELAVRHSQMRQQPLEDAGFIALSSYRRASYGHRTSPVRVLSVVATSLALHTAFMAGDKGATAFVTGADGFMALSWSRSSWPVAIRCVPAIRNIRACTEIRRLCGNACKSSAATVNVPAFVRRKS
jgi:hypothetical protein